MAEYYKRGPFKGSWIAPTRRERVRRWFFYVIERWDDMAYEREWPDTRYAPEWGVLDKVSGWTCRLAGHIPEAGCHVPAHDYCRLCNSPTPGAGPRKVRA